MARYIDIEGAGIGKANREQFLVPEFADGWNAVLKILEKEPTADVVEVKHGYNKTSMHPVDEFWCSECGFCCADYTETKYDEDGDYTYSCECEFDYCPRCGAKMDGRSDTDA